MNNSTKVWVLLLSFLLIGCNDNDFAENPTESIIGTWQLIESLIDIGDGNGDWRPVSVNDGYAYNFSPDGEFTSDRFDECAAGSYSISSVDSELTLVYDCDGFTQGIEEPAGTFIEQFRFESNDLILKPTYIFCTEQCGLKFRKAE